MSQTMDRVRVGVIGVGQIGKRHVETYAKMNNAELVAIADINAAEAQRVGRTGGHSSRLHRSCANCLPATIFRQSMSVSTTTFTCRPRWRRWKQAKNVFCEKPMAGAYVDALTMWEMRPGNRAQAGYPVCRRCTATKPRPRRISSTMATWAISTMRAPADTAAAGGPMWTATAAPPLCRSNSRPAARSMTWASIISPLVLYLLGNPPVARISGKTYQVIDMDAEASHRQRL